MFPAELSFSISFNREELQHCRATSTFQKESPEMAMQGTLLKCHGMCGLCKRSLPSRCDMGWQKDNTPFEKDH